MELDDSSVILLFGWLVGIYATTLLPTLMAPYVFYCLYSHIIIVGGKFVPYISGTVGATPCAPGTYQDQTRQSTCKPCASGYACPGSASEYQTLCPLGRFCTNSTSIAPFCPDGSFGNTTGLQSVTQCTVCYPGYYCEQGIIQGECRYDSRLSNSVFRVEIMLFKLLLISFYNFIIFGIGITLTFNIQYILWNCNT